MLIPKDLKEKICQMQPLIILGMHRSGTSLTVRLLKDMGIYLGTFLSRDAEAVHFQKINRRIYGSAGSKWGDVDSLIQAMQSKKFVQMNTEKALEILFPERRILNLNQDIQDYFGEKVWEAISNGNEIHWGWKDPRTTLTFPIWLQIFPNARFLHILRNGVDVAISIHRRSIKQHGKIYKRIFPIDYCEKTLDFDYCFELWEKYIAFVCQNKEIIPPENYLEIRYEDLLANPNQNLQRIAQFTEFTVDENTLNLVCEQIDKGRLVNTDYAKPYKEKIRTFVESQWMLRLGYSYQVVMEN